MIYRSWSLLSSTAVVCGGAVAAGFAGVFLFCGKEKFRGYLCREGVMLRHQDRVTMISANGQWTMIHERPGPSDNEMKTADDTTL